MKRFFISCWLRFIKWFKIDWILLILPLSFIYIMQMPICTYDLRKAERYEIESLKSKMDSTEMRTYIDKKYNAKIFYPAFFYEKDTSGIGSAHFIYLGSQLDVSLELDVDTNIVWRNVEEAVTRQVDNSDSTVMCLDRGKDYYLIKDRGDSYSILRKSFLIDNHWIRYTLSYDNKCEKIIGRLINLFKEWDPRKECKNEEVY